MIISNTINNWISECTEMCQLSHSFPVTSLSIFVLPCLHPLCPTLLHPLSDSIFIIGSRACYKPFCHVSMSNSLSDAPLGRKDS